MAGDSVNAGLLSPQLSSEEAAGLQDVLAVWERQAARFEAYTLELARQIPELSAALSPGDPEASARRAYTRELLRAGIGRGDISEYLAAVRKQARDLAGRHVPFPAVVAFFTQLLPLFDRVLVESYGDDQPRLIRALNSLNRLVGLVIGAIGMEYTEVRESLLEEEYRTVVRELSVPVVPVWHGVLVIPVIGVLDSARARQMTERLLEAIVEHRASVAIVDITGVPTVDTQVADYLIRAVKAAKLLGTTSILVGIRPAIAHTLVHLGVDLTGVQTQADLRSGLEVAFRVLGYRIEREPRHG